MPSSDQPPVISCEPRPCGSLLIRTNGAMANPVLTTGCWLHNWAGARPGSVFLSERNGAGWRELTYGEALEAVCALASALLDRGLGPTTPILILSGNGIDHALLSLAAQYVGIPIAPLPPHYSTDPAARARLHYAIDLIDPALVFAEDGAAFRATLALDQMAGRDLVVSRNASDGMTELDELLRGGTSDHEAAHHEVGPDSVVKILMTAGSCALPKAVRTTHRMMCTNQVQMAEIFAPHAPRVVDCLPWSNAMGGSLVFNLVCARGGTLFIDHKPAVFACAPDLHRQINGTIATDTAQGFTRLRDTMVCDHDLRLSFFAELELLFCAGGPLPRDVASDLARMAADLGRPRPRIVSIWGMTETGPACTVQNSPETIGRLLPGVALKLVPQTGRDNRYEARVRGPNVTPGYHRDPEATRAAFDAEGYLSTGDALAFVDPGNSARGLRFDGRI